MEEEVKIRDYLRKLSKNDIGTLQTKYNSYLKRSRGGFFQGQIKQKLLHLKKWDQYATSDDISKVFYDIREHARSGIVDLMLLCDTLSGSQIKEIFEYVPKGEIKEKISKTNDINEHQKFYLEMPSIVNVLRAILNSEEKSIKPAEEKIWQGVTAYLQPDAWKFDLVHHIIDVCFEFLNYNQLITSKAHQRLVEEVRDMISSEERNKYIPILQRIRIVG